MHPLLVPIVMPLILAGLMAGEWALGKALGRPTRHGRRQTLNNLAVTVVYKLYGAVFAVAPFFGYAAVQQGIGLWTWSTTNPLHWLAAWLILDFTMYWRHRAAHRIAALWAIHAVHHQSEEYNTTVAARASMFQDTVLVVMPLALLGAPLSMGMAVFASISIVTFFSHTELVGRLGWLDRVFVTPSVHRVHHARNPQYLDKNFGASLVIWDRLFGTWAPEDETPEYGTLDGLESFDPIVNNLSPWQTLIHKARQAPNLYRGLQTLIRSPDWDPATASSRLPEAKPRSPQTRSPRPIRYLIAVALLTLGITVQLFLAMSAPLNAVIAAVVAALGLALLGLSGAVLDRAGFPRPL